MTGGICHALASESIMQHFRGTTRWTCIIKYVLYCAACPHVVPLDARFYRVSLYVIWDSSTNSCVKLEVHDTKYFPFVLPKITSSSWAEPNGRRYIKKQKQRNRDRLTHTLVLWAEAACAATRHDLRSIIDSFIKDRTKIGTRGPILYHCVGSHLCTL